MIWNQGLRLWGSSGTGKWPTQWAMPIATLLSVGHNGRDWSTEDKWHHIGLQEVYYQWRGNRWVQSNSNVTCYYMADIIDRGGMERAVRVQAWDPLIFDLSLPLSSFVTLNELLHKFIPFCIWNTGMIIPIMHGYCTDTAVSDAWQVLSKLQLFLCSLQW